MGGLWMLAYLEGVWWDAGGNANEFPEVEPECVVRDRVLVQLVVVLCSLALDIVDLTRFETTY